MISLMENMLIFSDNKLIPSEELSSSHSPQYGFSSPEKALMNALRTPQLNPSESISSPDYDEFNSRANSGYSPDGYSYSNSGIFNIDDSGEF